MFRSFPFEVHAPAEDKRDRSYVVSIKIGLSKADDAKDVLHYLRSQQLRTDFSNGWAAKNAPNHGIELKGGPMPITHNPKDLSSEVIGYEQELRLTRGL